MPAKKYIVFKKYGRCFAVPLSKARSDPRVRRLLEGCLIVEITTEKSLFSKRKRVYRVKKARKDIIQKVKLPSSKIESVFTISKRVEKKIKVKKTRKPTGRTMPASLQKYKLEQLMRKHGVEFDVIDLDALIDPKLTYPENRRIIENKIKILKVGKDIYELEEIDEHRLRWEERKFIEKLAQFGGDEEKWLKHEEKRMRDLYGSGGYSIFDLF